MSSRLRVVRISFQGSETPQNVFEVGQSVWADENKTAGRVSQATVDAGRDPRVYRFAQETELQAVIGEGEHPLEDLLHPKFQPLREVTVVRIVRNEFEQSEDEEKERAAVPLLSSREEAILAARMPYVTQIIFDVTRPKLSTLPSAPRWRHFLSRLTLIWPAVCNIGWTDQSSAHFVATSLSLPRWPALIGFTYELDRLEDRESFHEDLETVLLHLTRHQKTHFGACRFDLTDLLTLPDGEAKLTPCKGWATLVARGLRLHSSLVLSDLREGASSMPVRDDRKALDEIFLRATPDLVQIDLDWMRRGRSWESAFQRLDRLRTLVITFDANLRVVSKLVLPAHLKRLYVHDLVTPDDIESRELQFELLTHCQRLWQAHPALEQVFLPVISDYLEAHDLTDTVSAWLRSYLDQFLKRSSIGRERHAMEYGLQWIADTTGMHAIAGSIRPLFTLFSTLAGIGAPLTLNL